VKKSEQRSRWELILDILGVISEEGRRAKKTRIMKRAYLDWTSFEKYFDQLLERGFIEKIEDPTSGTIYGLTESGRDLKKRLYEIEAILQ
jgi:predicted transcriptional regulator